MGNPLETQTNSPFIIMVAANEDQFGEKCPLGVSRISFKVTPKGSSGTFIIENTFHPKG